MSYRLTALIIKGEQSQFDQLTKPIEKLGLSIKTVNTSEAAINYLQVNKPGFIFMDLTIDGKNAIDLLSEIQGLPVFLKSIIVVFSERTEHYVQVSALNAGADDVLLKPVNKRVFASKLNTWIRRMTSSERAHDSTQVNGDFSLDRERYSLVVKNEEVSLQRKEFEIISLLVSRPRKVFSRKEIRQTVWGSSEKGKNRTIDVHIRNLRSKIGPDYIRTYKGVGYSFDK